MMNRIEEAVSDDEYLARIPSLQQLLFTFALWERLLYV